MTTPERLPNPPASDAPRSVLPASLSDSISPDNVEERTEQIIASVSVREAVQRMSADEQASFKDALRQQLPIYLSGDFERFISFLEDAGAAHPLLDEKTASANWSDYQEFWIYNGAGVFGNNISLRDVSVRPLFINGKPIDHETLSLPDVQMAHESRYGLGSLRDDAVSRRLTIYEILVPVLYEREEVRGPVWWGLALALIDEPGHARWVPWRSSIYDPASIGVKHAPGI